MNSMNAISMNYFGFLVLVALLLAGCDKKSTLPPAQPQVRKHEHKPPHHGTPVVLGDEEYHVELVLDAALGTMQAYVMDGELENFIRILAESFEIAVNRPGGGEILKFKAVPNNATGEKVGDTSMFEAQADWLKTTGNFEAVIKALEVRGKEYQNVPFNFPKGNDKDEK
jgi:hypothetical protein